MKWMLVYLMCNIIFMLNPTDSKNNEETDLQATIDRLIHKVQKLEKELKYKKMNDCLVPNYSANDHGDACSLHRSETAHYDLVLSYCRKGDDFKAQFTELSANFGPPGVSVLAINTRRNESWIEQKNTTHNSIDIMPKDYCYMLCVANPSCTSSFWKNSPTYECEVFEDKDKIVNYKPGTHYFCKDCTSTTALIKEGLEANVITLVNVALNKRTEALSENDENESELANDGDYHTHYHSKFPTDDQEWLMIDLEERYMVAQIQMFTRGWDSWYRERGGSFIVYLTDYFHAQDDPFTNYTEILRVNIPLTNSAEKFFVDKAVMGRYVIFKKQIAGIFEIAEILVNAVVPIT